MENNCCKKPFCDQKAKQELSIVLEEMLKHLDHTINERKSILKDFKKIEHIIYLYSCVNISRCLDERLGYVKSKIEKPIFSPYCLREEEREAIRSFIKSLEE